MTTLLVGFDSAWTLTNSGALVGVLVLDDKTFQELGPPRVADYPDATDAIVKWQEQYTPSATTILLDQPTIVSNLTGQRPVENIVGAAVSRRRGGMQPANRSRENMFGEDAPIWPFLANFGGPRNPIEPVGATNVIETYPVLEMIALGWTLPDVRPAGRLPKYNPERRGTFSIDDWRYVCHQTFNAFSERRGLDDIVSWIDDMDRNESPRKCDQDKLDACLCLLAALYLAEQRDCLIVGNLQTGYILVPYGADLHVELDARCVETGLTPSQWVRRFSPLPRLPVA